MTIPTAFRNEPYSSLSIGTDFYQHEVLQVLDISISEFANIRAHGHLKPMDPACATPRYCRAKVVAFKWGLATSPHHADVIAFLIGRRGDGWASSDDAE